MGRVKLKRRRKKRDINFKFKYLIYMVIIYFSCNAVFNYLSDNSFNIESEEFLNVMLREGNHRIIYEYDRRGLLNKVISYVSLIDLEDPTSITKNTLSKIVSIDYDDLIIDEEHVDDYSNMDELASQYEHMEDPNPVEVSDPYVYIYNTHQLEDYSSGSLADYNIESTVQIASYILKEELIKSGIGALVDENDVAEFLRLNNWNYAKSYAASRIFVKDALKEYPSIGFLIDIHRDSIRKKQSTIEIDGVSYAKVLFVVGLDHDDYIVNLELAKVLCNNTNEKHEGLCRGVITKGGNGVNGIYNQDLSSNAILIEVGGVDNTIDEVNNTVKAFSKILIKYLEDKNESF